MSLRGKGLKFCMGYLYMKINVKPYLARKDPFKKANMSDRS